MKYYFAIKKILSKKEIIIFSFISVGLVITSIIELFGISLIIPIVYTLTSDNFYFEIVKLLSVYDIINLSKNEILQIALILFALIFLIKNILLGIFFWFEGKFIYSVSEKISSKMFKKFLYKDFSYHLKENSANLISKINIELNYIKSFFVSLLNFISEIIIFFGLIIVLLFLSSEILFKVLPLFIFFFLLYYLFFNKILKKSGEDRKKNDYLKTKKVQESIGGIREIITFEKEKYFSDIYDEYIDKLIKVFYRYHFLSKLPKIYFETLAIMGIVSFSLLVLLRTSSPEKFIATLTVFVAISLRLLPSINRIVNSINNFKYCFPSFVSVGKELSIKKNKIRKRNDVKVFKSLELKNIFFKFPKSNYNIFLNLKIKSGEKIGILGESGSGKTTLIHILLGLYRPLNGDIFLNNIKKTNTDLRGLISYVPQSVYIFDDTIIENVTFGDYNEITDKKKLSESLKYSCSDNFIKELTQKVFSKAGEGGSKLSQGQKQRIGIARALYKNSSILVLDEITSSLDGNNSKKILNQILKIKNKTIIFSTHKPELLKNFDKVLRIKKGKLFIEKKNKI
jgi:ABC-type multidrug transport system fused ATPase/permease subunit